MTSLLYNDYSVQHSYVMVSYRHNVAGYWCPTRSLHEAAEECHQCTHISPTLSQWGIESRSERRFSPTSCKNCHKLLYSMYDDMTFSLHQISHKLLLQALASLKHGMKSGTAEHRATGESGGMVQALVDVANFCDRALRAKEDEGTPHLEILHMHTHL